MLTLKACGSGWTPARDAYNGLANSPVSQTGVREHFCNCCATRISTVYQADVRPSRALTMERLADLRSSDVPPGSGQTSQIQPHLVKLPTGLPARSGSRGRLTFAATSTCGRTTLPFSKSKRKISGRIVLLR